MSAPTLEALTTALAGVSDPVFGGPMLELGSLEILGLDGQTAKLRARLPSPSPALADAVRKRVEEAAARAGVQTVELAVDAEVPTREVMGDDPIPGVRNVILVMAGKGGVGKSTTSVNLALALSTLGMRVGLLDADVFGPSIPTMMGVSGRPTSKDGKRLTPLERFGVEMMSIGFLLEDDKQAVVWRGPRLHNLLEQFLGDVDWGELDFLVLDLPPGTGDVALTVAQKMKVTGVVMVTTPQEVALADVYKAVSMCQRLNLPILGVVENMSWFVDPTGAKHELFGKGGGEKVAAYAKAPLLGQVPIETAVREWGDKGVPVVKSAPTSEAAQVFLKVADEVSRACARQHFERTGGAKIPASKGPTRLRIVR